MLTTAELIELLATSPSFRITAAETIIRLMTDAPTLLDAPACDGCEDCDLRAILDNWE